MKVTIAGTPVELKEGESMSAAIKRVVKENRKNREEERGYSNISVDGQASPKTEGVKKYKSNDSQRGVRSLQDKLKERREKK